MNEQPNAEALKLPAWLASELAFQHMPGLNRAGLLPPPTIKRVTRSRVQSIAQDQGLCP
jgi:hypothetical protein